MRAQSYLIYAKGGLLKSITKGHERYLSGTIVATHRNKGKRYPYRSFKRGAATELPTETVFDRLAS